MISFGRWGRYKGRSYFFTHRNPKNGYLFSETLGGDGWVPSDKVVWEKKGAKN